MLKKKEEKEVDKNDNDNEEFQWPIYKLQKYSKKFWNKDTTLSTPIAFESSLMRIGKRKKKPCSYYYRVISHGYLKYFKNERDKVAKGQIKLTLHINACFIEIKEIKAIGIKLYLTQKLFITLYSSDECILSMFSALKQFCLMSGFDMMYKSIKFLGSGSFGKVYKFQNKYSTSECAAKIYTKEQYENHHNKKRLSEMIVNEIETLKRLQDPNIMELYEVYQEEDRLILICELIEGQELYDHITDVKRIEEKDAAHIIKKICQGLNTIHKNGYVHRDIKLENIMIKKQGNGSYMIKIVDFGFAEKINEEKLMNKAGTPGYIPPELFESKPYTDKGDIFSLGVILYAIVSGYSCFYGKNVQEITKDNKRCMVTFNKKIWKEISIQCKDLINSMLQKIPQLRFSAEQCLKSQWLKLNTTESSIQEIQEIDECEELIYSKKRQASYNMKSNESSCSFQYEFSPRDVKSFYARSSNKTFKTEKTSKSNFSQKSSNSIYNQIHNKIRIQQFLKKKLKYAFTDIQTYEFLIQIERDEQVKNIQNTQT